jgi:hypothetical protein
MGHGDMPSHAETLAQWKIPQVQNANKLNPLNSPNPRTQTLGIDGRDLSFEVAHRRDENHDIKPVILVIACPRAKSRSIVYCTVLVDFPELAPGSMCHQRWGAPCPGPWHGRWSWVRRHRPGEGIKRSRGDRWEEVPAEWDSPLPVKCGCGLQLPVWRRGVGVRIRLAARVSASWAGLSSPQAGNYCFRVPTGQKKITHDLPVLIRVEYGCYLWIKNHTCTQPHQIPGGYPIPVPELSSLIVA